MAAAKDTLARYVGVLPMLLWFSSQLFKFRRFMKMGKSEIIEILNFMKIIYQGRRIDDSEDTINTWMIMFAEYSKDKVMQAIKRLATKNKFVPSIHEILENIADSFVVERMNINGAIVIRVKYQDGIYPLRFRDKESAIEVVNYLKTHPSREDIEMLHERNVREMNPFVGLLYVDQSDREEFDKRIKNAYYAQKVKAF